MTQIFIVKDEVKLKFNSVCFVKEQRGDMKVGFYMSMSTDSSDIGVTVEAYMGEDVTLASVVYPETYGEFKMVYPKHKLYVAQACIKIGEPDPVVDTADEPTKD